METLNRKGNVDFRRRSALRKFRVRIGNDIFWVCLDQLAKWGGTLVKKLKRKQELEIEASWMFNEFLTVTCPYLQGTNYEEITEENIGTILKLSDMFEMGGLFNMCLRELLKAEYEVSTYIKLYKLFNKKCSDDDGLADEQFAIRPTIMRRLLDHEDQDELNFLKEDRNCLVAEIFRKILESTDSLRHDLVEKVEDDNEQKLCACLGLEENRTTTSTIFCTTCMVYVCTKCCKFCNEKIVPMLIMHHMKNRQPADVESNSETSSEEWLAVDPAEEVDLGFSWKNEESEPWGDMKIRTKRNLVLIKSDMKRMRYDEDMDDDNT